VFALSLECFERDVLPGLAGNDLVVGLEAIGGGHSAAAAAAAGGNGGSSLGSSPSPPSSALRIDRDPADARALEHMLERAARAGAIVARVTCAPRPSCSSSSFPNARALSSFSFLPVELKLGGSAGSFDLGAQACFAVKLVTNAITTGGMVLRGATVGNKYGCFFLMQPAFKFSHAALFPRLVCMTLANNKIFCRGTASC
jgi:hypothetical protein